MRQIHSYINDIVGFIHFDWPQPVNFDDLVQLRWQFPHQIPLVDELPDFDTTIPGMSFCLS